LDQKDCGITREIIESISIVELDMLQIKLGVLEMLAQAVIDFARTVEEEPRGTAIPRTPLSLSMSNTLNTRF
jgi:hypothetical protein